jgi:hypothetical protein
LQPAARVGFHVVGFVGSPRRVSPGSIPDSTRATRVVDDLDLSDSGKVDVMSHQCDRAGNDSGRDLDYQSPTDSQRLASLTDEANWRRADGA